MLVWNAQIKSKINKIFEQKYWIIKNFSLKSFSLVCAFWATAIPFKNIAKLFAKNILVHKLSDHGFTWQAGFYIDFLLAAVLCY